MVLDDLEGCKTGSSQCLQCADPKIDSVHVLNVRGHSRNKFTPKRRNGEHQSGPCKKGTDNKQSARSGRSIIDKITEICPSPSVPNAPTPEQNADEESGLEFLMPMCSMQAVEIKFTS